MTERAYVGRLAPSPTGALHLGNARTFMIAWLRARSQGGKVVFRMEDLDHPRDKPGAATAAVEDLRWLGFDWDAEYVQSERRPFYREALEKLIAAGRAYPCVCSRRDVETAQSAPHDGEQLFYPGICRGRFATWNAAIDHLRAQGAARIPCWRFRVDEGEKVAFRDAFAGDFEQDVSRTLGDFPLARDEFGAGYTLAVEGKSFNALVFAGEKASVMQNRNKMFADTNINMIAIQPDMSHLFEIDKALTDGGIVSMPADRINGSQKCIEHVFLGAKAKFPLGPFSVATMRGLDVLAVNVMKNSLLGYKIYVTPLAYDKEASRQEQIRQLSSAYVAELEKRVWQYPTQWYNYFEFWQEG